MGVRRGVINWFCQALSRCGITCPCRKLLKLLSPVPKKMTCTRLVLNKKVYEVSDHLGNVRAVVSVEKHATLRAGVPGTLVPEMIAGNNYYPFGDASGE